VTLLPRRAVASWMRAARPFSAAVPTIATPEGQRMSTRARAIDDYLRQHGASFFDEIVDGTRMLRTQVEDALGELVALGIVSSDSFAGLRGLLTPSQKRKPLGGRSRQRRSLFGIEDAGRWSLIRRAQPGAPSPLDAETVEHLASALLRRYGVVFWRLLEREAGTLPPWRELLRTFRRMEARGELRGGRFVAGISGEQFALPEAVALLRETRRAPPPGTFVLVCGADPLNLVGVVLPGAKVPALTNNRVLYRDGIPVATFVGDEIRWLETLDPAVARVAEDALVKRTPGAPLLAYLR
jgi:ATP-dependent Lhr-like helicase